MAKRDYLTLDDFDYRGKTVLLRLDINSPIDSKTKKITNENRIVQSLPTIEALVNKGAKLVIIAHQGDTLDYQNLIPLAEHAEKLSQKLGREVQFIDDVAGPAAREGEAREGVSRRAGEKNPQQGRAAGAERGIDKPAEKRPSKNHRLKIRPGELLRNQRKRS